MHICYNIKRDFFQDVYTIFNRIWLTIWTICAFPVLNPHQILVSLAKKDNSSLMTQNLLHLIIHLTLFLCSWKQNRSTEGCLKFKIQKHVKFRRGWSQHKNKPRAEQDQVSGGKRPLLSSRFRCKCPIETSQNLVIRYKSVIRSSLVTRSRFSEMSDQWKVSLFMVMPKNVVQHLGEGSLYSYIDHRTS